nr:hypothetical protein CFP56_28733 [Quercus suber]
MLAARIAYTNAHPMTPATAANETKFVPRLDAPLTGTEEEAAGSDPVDAAKLEEAVPLVYAVGHAAEAEDDVDDAMVVDQTEEELDEDGVVDVAQELSAVDDQDCERVAVTVWSTRAVDSSSRGKNGQSGEPHGGLDSG